ncbi:sigma 54-interacting transcriptional regulator [Lentisphaerota bacterium WC36G]|nr:sigma-54 factor interaction domain-containing protein [Lentisphaerae bacterium WC36]
MINIITFGQFDFKTEQRVFNYKNESLNYKWKFKDHSKAQQILGASKEFSYSIKLENGLQEIGKGVDYINTIEHYVYFIDDILKREQAKDKNKDKEIILQIEEFIQNFDYVDPKEILSKFHKFLMPLKENRKWSKAIDSFKKTYNISNKYLFLFPECTEDKELMSKLEKIAEEKTKCIELFQLNISFAKFSSDLDNKNEIFYPLQYLSSIIMENILEEMTDLDDTKKGLISKNEGPILLCGGTGTGKTSFARRFAKNADKKLHIQPLSSRSKNLIESEIFGYEEGAFTGAKTQKIGVLEKADNQVVLLDDFQDVDVDIQSKLLHCLNPFSNKFQIQRLGSSESVDINNQLLIAINEDINKLIRTKKLKTDIFFRMSHYIKFMSLNEKIKKHASIDSRNNNPNNSLNHFFNKLLQSAKCQFACNITEDTIVSDIELRLFPDLTNYYDSICEVDWFGNFRQISKFFRDLFSYLELNYPSSKAVADSLQFHKELNFSCNSNNNVEQMLKKVIEEYSTLKKDEFQKIFYKTVYNLCENRKNESINLFKKLGVGPKHLKTFNEHIEKLDINI